jgi:hypothetical protein
MSDHDAAPAPLKPFGGQWAVTSEKDVKKENIRAASTWCDQKIPSKRVVEAAQAPSFGVFVDESCVQFKLSMCAMFNADRKPAERFDKVKKMRVLTDAEM